MASIGKDQFLVKILRQKTKIKTEDIAEILNLLPECLSEAFFEANPDEKELVNFGAILMFWKDTNFGPGIFFRPSRGFRKRFLMTKYMRKTSLAITLYNKMVPNNREKAINRIEKLLQDSNTEN